MTDSDAHAFRQLVRTMADTMGKFPSDGLMDGWWWAMKGADFDEFERAALRLLQHATKMPVPSEAWALIRDERREHRERTTLTVVDDVAREPCPDSVRADLKGLLGIVVGGS